MQILFLGVGSVWIHSFGSCVTVRIWLDAHARTPLLPPHCTCTRLFAVTRAHHLACIYLRTHHTRSLTHTSSRLHAPHCYVLLCTPFTSCHTHNISHSLITPRHRRHGLCLPTSPLPALCLTARTVPHHLCTLSSARLRRGFRIKRASRIIINAGASPSLRAGSSGYLWFSHNNHACAHQRGSLLHMLRTHSRIFCRAFRIARRSSCASCVRFGWQYSWPSRAPRSVASPARHGACSWR